jgi:addiction module HigA family antidote
MLANRMRPVHPGEILREDYLVPLGMTATALAKALNVPAPRINDIVRERRSVTADTAMRLARYFGGDARSWLNLQAAYDLRVAEIRNAKAHQARDSPGGGVESRPSRSESRQRIHQQRPLFQRKSLSPPQCWNARVAQDYAGAATFL